MKSSTRNNTEKKSLDKDSSFFSTPLKTYFEYKANKESLFLNKQFNQSDKSPFSKT